MTRTNVSIWIDRDSEPEGHIVEPSGTPVVLLDNSGPALYFGVPLGSREYLAREGIAGIDRLIAALQTARAQAVEAGYRASPLLDPQVFMVTLETVKMPEIPARLELDPANPLRFRRWNGAVYPYFDRAAIDTILNCLPSLGYKASTVRWDESHPVPQLVGDDGVASIVDDQGVRRWPLGAGAWTWATRRGPLATPWQTPTVTDITESEAHALDGNR